MSAINTPPKDAVEQVSTVPIDGGSEWHTLPLPSRPPKNSGFDSRELGWGPYARNTPSNLPGPHRALILPRIREMLNFSPVTPQTREMLNLPAIRLEARETSNLMSIRSILNDTELRSESHTRNVCWTASPFGEILPASPALDRSFFSSKGYSRARRDAIPNPVDLVDLTLTENSAPNQAPAFLSAASQPSSNNRPTVTSETEATHNSPATPADRPNSKLPLAEEPSRRRGTISLPIPSPAPNGLTHPPQSNEPGPVFRSYKCQECPKTFKTKRKAGTHYRLVHGERRFNCDAREEIFQKNSVLHRHVRLVHLGERLFKCDECKATFQPPGSLNAHLRLGPHEERRFRCDACGAAYQAPWFLKTHMNSCALARKSNAPRQWPTSASGESLEKRAKGDEGPMSHEATQSAACEDLVVSTR
jgi:DNA-directed RNA polymerase subunit RPC12/RpoP